MKFALWLYQRLAHGFPHEFQVIYGTDVIQLGEDAVEDIAKQHGIMGLFSLVADLAYRIPIEYLSEMRRDLAYAARTLIKSPGFAAVGVISLGLGIGVTSTIFSEIHMLIFRDLPLVPEPARLVMAQAVSYPYFEQYRDQHNLFAASTAYMQGVAFGIGLEHANPKAERVFGQIVSPEYFSVLGIPPQRGRVFSVDADKPGEAPVVVIGDRFWRERLNSDPDAVGRVVRLNGQTATIVGITPKDFLGAMPIVPSDIFVPTTVSARTAPELGDDVLHKKDAKSFTALFRLAPGVTTTSAEAALDTLTRHLDESSLDPDRDRKGRRVRLLPGGMILPLPPEMRPGPVRAVGNADGVDPHHRVHESGEYAAGAGGRAAARNRDSSRGRGQPLPFDPPVAHRKRVAFDGRRRGWTRLCLLDDQRRFQHEDAGIPSISLRYPAGLGGDGVHAVPGFSDRHRFRARAGFCRDESRRFAHTQGRRRFADARLPALRNAQPAGCVSSGRLPDAAADDRIFGPGVQQYVQRQRTVRYPNHVPDGAGSATRRVYARSGCRVFR